jgi:hypothetical protein
MIEISDRSNGGGKLVYYYKMNGESDNLRITEADMTRESRDYDFVLANISPYDSLLTFEQDFSTF